MSLKTPKISKLKDLFEQNLELPTYQRPYSWIKNSANTLFVDTYKAFKSGINEYRIGTVILHEYEDKLNVVDGQQRLTTLSILLYCLKYEGSTMLGTEYSSLSYNVIRENYAILKNRVHELNEDERGAYRNYLLNKCTVVKIVTDSEQEAFQFFDSQNTRGKELEPHDLLKSYHLREMQNEEEIKKVQIINHWENIKEKDLSDLFKNYLYPLNNWYKNKNGTSYSSKNIDLFKGIKGSNVNNYAIYHKASNLYIEQFNQSGNNELLGSKLVNQFQLTQPIIAGRRFFDYTLHYEKLLEKIQIKIDNFAEQIANSKKYFNRKKEDVMPCSRAGDIYTKQLFECSLLFYADRFGLDSLDDYVIRYFYTWCYSLRLVMQAVYPQTINNYAKGTNDRVNEGLAMFNEISEMKESTDLSLIVLENPNIHSNNKEKDRYKIIYRLLCEWNNQWESGELSE